MPLKSFETREDVLRFISKSASYGNLGLFIGTGFSKAVINDDDFTEIALSWYELLLVASKELDVDFEDIAKPGVSFPEIATKMCLSYSDKKKIPYQKSLIELKNIIASLTSWYPDQNKRAKFSSHLESFSPAWIVTTNYDLIIETLLTGKSISLGPDDYLTRPKGLIPVYHLHGLRTNPSEIVISQEDYVSLFRPNEYRQIKLTLTLRESTVLLLGYGLGDVNVLTALDWSQFVFSRDETNFPHDVIQVLRKNEPKEMPYRDKSNILIIETNELSSFFEEFAEIRHDEVKEEDRTKEAVLEVLKLLDDPESINAFIDKTKFRKLILKNLAEAPFELVSGFIPFLDKCISETWARTAPYGAFEGYNQNLRLLLDILSTFHINSIPPVLLQISAQGLQNIASYIGRESGQSFAAANTWEARRSELSSEMVRELKDIARQHSYTNLIKLLNPIDR